ncbi:hypothetical protein E2C01_008389 [Portunus trituberculatus]|uniref:Uncharacterized protein n=1 Tax=Portunus trituberculatus TaxID=210409 RepID=A0A5B7D1Q9_PORTR|nr:hypothetical protein [Portunus trituberculatus]
MSLFDIFTRYLEETGIRIHFRIRKKYVYEICMCTSTLWYLNSHIRCIFSTCAVRICADSGSIST